jgi:eukaryotic translation initiation factor 2C
MFCCEQVELKYEDGQPVEQKGVGTKVIEKLMETYASELANKNFAYDGEKNLFMIHDVP